MPAVAMGAVSGGVMALGAVIFAPGRPPGDDRQETPMAGNPATALGTRDDARGGSSGLAHRRRWSDSCRNRRINFRVTTR